MTFGKYLVAIALHWVMLIGYTEMMGGPGHETMAQALWLSVVGTASLMAIFDRGGK